MDRRRPGNREGMPSCEDVLTDQDGLISRRQALDERQEASRTSPACSVGGSWARRPRRRVRRSHRPAHLAAAGRAADGALLLAGGVVARLGTPRQRWTGPTRPRRRSTIHVAVEPGLGTSSASPDGVEVHRQLTACPACALEPGSPAGPLRGRGAGRGRRRWAPICDAVAALADACGSRRTTAVRLLAILAARARASPGAESAPGRAAADVAEGTCSVLEHGVPDAGRAARTS